MNIVSLFTGAGGLDLGFKQAGFKTIFANEFDKEIWQTFEHNFPDVTLDKRSIIDIKKNDIPNCIGIIGGPPCQSWSEAGSRSGIKDKRGKLFYQYIRVLKEKNPLFFLAENVSGILHKSNQNAFANILDEFKKLDYKVSYWLVDANDFKVAQNRKRVIIVGYKNKLKKKFTLAKKISTKPVLKDVIFDLTSYEPKKSKQMANKNCKIANHEYLLGGFSSIYMSRNRVRAWSEPSFTILASARHIPIHPQAPKMKLIAKDQRIFEPKKEHLYRRFTIRECARIQGFPDSYIFKYNKLTSGYKMVGNAVPVNLAKAFAKKILMDLTL